MKRGRGRPPYPGLFTPSEDRVLALVREGCSNGEIAQRLGISVQGVKFHVSNLLAKAEVPTRYDLANWNEPERKETAPVARSPRIWLRAVTAAAAALAIGIGALTSFAVWSNQFEGDPNEPVSPSPVSDTHDGITVSVRRALADANSTRVVLQVEGRPELGRGVMPLEQATIELPTGETLREFGGAPADPSNPRLVVREFPPLPFGIVRFTIRLNGMVLVTPPTTNLVPPATVTVNQVWTLAVELARPVSPGERLSAAPLDPPLDGPQVTIEEVIRTPDSVMIRGRLRGVAPEAVPQLTMTASAESVEGTLVPRRMRWGFGEDRAEFTILLPSFSGAARLSCKLNLNGGPGDPSASPVIFDQPFQTTFWEFAIAPYEAPRTQPIGAAPAE